MPARDICHDSRAGAGHKVENGQQEKDLLMAKITITKDNLLSLAEFKALLEHMETRSSTMDYIFRLLQELVAFEEKFNTPSDVFYARFMRGEMGDDLPFIKWAGRYELYLKPDKKLTVSWSKCL